MAPIVVHFRCVSYTSYRFLQTSPLASDALAIQIVFPVIGATLASFSEAGLPALPGKQKKPESIPALPNPELNTPALSAEAEAEKKWHEYDKILSGYRRNPKKAKIQLSTLDEIWRFQMKGKLWFRNQVTNNVLREAVTLEMADGAGAQVWLIRFFDRICEPLYLNYIHDADFSLILNLFLQHCNTNISHEARVERWLILENYLAGEDGGRYGAEKPYLKEKKTLLSPEVMEELAFFDHLEPFQKNSGTLLKSLNAQLKAGVPFCDLKIEDPRK